MVYLQTTERVTSNLLGNITLFGLDASYKIELSFLQTPPCVRRSHPKRIKISFLNFTDDRKMAEVCTSLAQKAPKSGKVRNRV